MAFLPPTTTDAFDTARRLPGHRFGQHRQGLHQIDRRERTDQL